MRNIFSWRKQGGVCKGSYLYLLKLGDIWLEKVRTLIIKTWGSFSVEGPRDWEQKDRDSDNSEQVFRRD